MILCDFYEIMFFGKDRPQSEGSRYAHPGIKSPPGLANLSPVLARSAWREAPLATLTLTPMGLEWYDVPG